MLSGYSRIRISLLPAYRQSCFYQSKTILINDYFPFWFSHDFANQSCFRDAFPVHAC
jgi:hypothetical protein